MLDFNWILGQRNWISKDQEWEDAFWVLEMERMPLWLKCEQCMGNMHRNETLEVSSILKWFKCHPKEFGFYAGSKRELSKTWNDWNGHVTTVKI